MNKLIVLLIATFFFAASAIPWNITKSFCNYPFENCFVPSNLQLSQVPDWGKTIHLEITFYIPTSFWSGGWMGPVPLQNCIVWTFQFNEQTDTDEYQVEHHGIDDKYKKDYALGQSFTLEYDLQIERNAFPRNGRYYWAIQPCLYSEERRECYPITFVYWTFTLGNLGNAEITENALQSIQHNLVVQQ